MVGVRGQWQRQHDNISFGQHAFQRVQRNHLIYVLDLFIDVTAHPDHPHPERLGEHRGARADGTDSEQQHRFPGKFKRGLPFAL